MRSTKLGPCHLDFGTGLVDELIDRIHDEGGRPHVVFGSGHPGGVGRGSGPLARGVVEHFGEWALKPRLARYLHASPGLIPAFCALLTGAPRPAEAEVLSADAFGAFEEVGLDDEDAVRKTGRRYRDTILALGGSRPPMEVFEAFRGRAPTTEALLRHSGLG